MVLTPHVTHRATLQPEAKQRPARKRKTDVKFVVVPAHKCQLLDDPLANACMYGGLEGVQAPDCRGARLSVIEFRV